MTDDTDPFNPFTIYYEYDKNGNTIKKIDGSLTNQEMTFTYNALDQLVETKRGPPGAESILGLYDYNASGLRVRHRLSERGDVDYYYDDNAVIEERNAADDTLLAHYRYADRLISLDMGDAKQYYHHDALGSTVNLTTAEAEVQVSYKLDPWGHIREQSGSSVNRLIFTGQEHDENTGLIYFGSRYYDPDTARFISQDSYLGENNLPPSLHRYLYAYSNPTVYIDLHGYRPATPEEEALFKLREKASAEYQNAYEEKNALGRIGDRVFWGDYQKARILEYLNIRHKAAIDAAADGEAVFAVPNPFGTAEVDVILGGVLTTVANSEFLTAREVKFLEHYSNLDAVAVAPPAAVKMIFDPGDTEDIQFWARVWETGTNAFTGKMSRNPNRTVRMTSESRSGGKEYVRSGDAKPARADTNKNLANDTDSVDPASTKIYYGKNTPKKEGATPNSIYVQKTEDGKVRSRSYYDEAGKQFSHEDFIQQASHKVVIDGKKYNLKSHPHEHQTRTFQGPNGPYQKRQVRILDQNGKPITDWVNSGK